MKKYPIVLTIAGSDSGGGAGIQADIKAISATGSYAESAITAVTVQNTLGVKAIHNVPENIVAGQIDAVLQDIGADAVKIGMLSSSAIIRCVKEALLRNGARNIVLDPVMVATSGDRLIDETSIEVLKNELAPFARVITPNIPEAEMLSGRKITRSEELPDIGRALSERLEALSGRKVSVFMKAGHSKEDDVRDYFFNAESGSVTVLNSRRIFSRNTHGTGCTLSSAFASFLAQGFTLDESAQRAKEYISKAIESGAEYTIGHGHGPVDHFWRNR